MAGRGAKSGAAAGDADGGYCHAYDQEQGKERARQGTHNERNIARHEFKVRFAAQSVKGRRVGFCCDRHVAIG